MILMLFATAMRLSSAPRVSGDVSIDNAKIGENYKSPITVRDGP